MDMINGIFLTMRREWLLAVRRPVEWLNPLLFFFLVSVLFPLTLAPNVKILQIIGPGILWIGLLLAILWSLSRLFQADYEDGSLEQWLFSPYPLPVLIFAKMVAHVLMLAIPVLLIAPLLSFDVSPNARSSSSFIRDINFGNAATDFYRGNWRCLDGERTANWIIVGFNFIAALYSNAYLHHFSTECSSNRYVAGGAHHLAGGIAGDDYSFGALDCRSHFKNEHSTSLIAIC